MTDVVHAGAADRPGLVPSTVLMLVANDVMRDPRVIKEAATLRRAGAAVTAVGLGREHASLRTSDGLDVVLVPNAPMLWLGRLRALFTRAPAGSGPAASAAPGADGVATRFRSLVRRMARAIHAWMLFRLTELAFARHIDAIARLPHEVVHAHDLNALGAAAAVARRTRAPLVYDTHELFPDMGGFGAWYRWWLVRRERSLIRRCAAVITVSDAIAAELVRRHGCASPAVVINAPVRAAATGHVATQRGERRRFLYLGGLTPGRGLELMVRAFALVQSDSELVIRGSGPLQQGLEALAARVAPGRVYFLPEVPMADVVRAAADADVGIIPFVPDTLNNRLALPNKLFEYLGAGLAVLSSDLVEVRALIERRGLGAVFAPFTESALAGAVDRLATADISSMKRSALAAFHDSLNWEQAEVELLRVYRALPPLAVASS